VLSRVLERPALVRRAWLEVADAGVLVSFMSLPDPVAGAIRKIIGSRAPEL